MGLAGPHADAVPPLGRVSSSARRASSLPRHPNSEVFACRPAYWCATVWRRAKNSLLSATLIQRTE